MAKGRLWIILIIAPSLLVVSLAGCSKSAAVEDLTERYENVTRLTTDRANDGNPAWSRDGSKIFFKQGDYICVMDSDGSNVKSLTEGGDFVLSPAGSKVFFLRGILQGGCEVGKEAWVMNADGSNQEKIDWFTIPPISPEKPIKLFPYSWNPDRTKIVYLRQDSTGQTWPWWHPEEGGLWERVEKPEEFPPEWMALVEYDRSWWIWDLEKKERKVLVCLGLFQFAFPYAEEVAWSPDGKKIAFPDLEIIDGLMQEHIWGVDVDSGERENLTSYVGVNAWPAWSPNGEKIKYLQSKSSRNTGDIDNFDIMVMNADGSEKRQLTDSPMDEDGYWSPDGSRIAYLSTSDVGGGYLPGEEHSYEDKSEIWVMNADGSDKQRLLGVPFPYGLIMDIAWSPGGTRLAFVWRPNYRLGGFENPGTDIYLIDVPAS